MVSGLTIPDYIGSLDIWKCIGNGNSLKIFVNERKKYSSKAEKIKGVLRDSYGSAEVKGRISSKALNLKIKYDLEAIAKGSPRDTINLQGNYEEGLYVGTWINSKGDFKDFVIEKVNTFFRDYHQGA